MPKRRVENLTWRTVGTDAARQHLGRWNPGPALRRHGFRAVDLWAGPGPALSSPEWQAIGFPAPVTAAIRGKASPRSVNRALPVAEAEAAVRALNQAAREVIDTGRTSAPASVKAAPRAVTIGDMLDAFIAHHGKRVDDGSLAPRTFESYRINTRRVREWVGPDVPAIVTKEFLIDGFEVLKAKRGHHAAHKIIGTFCTVLGWAHGRHPFVGDVMPDPMAYRKLNLRKPPGRLRVALGEETMALLRAFDDPGSIYDELGRAKADRVLQPRPSLGDALTLLLWTCARVEDGLMMADEHETQHAGQPFFTYRPGKTNHGDARKVVSVPILGPLMPRVRQMRARRSALRLNAPTSLLIVNEELRRGYVKVSARKGISQHNHFTKHWNLHRALAGELAPSLVGKGVNPLGDPWLPFTASDCRDTAATRLWEATGRLDKVSLYHGSDPAELARLAKHYIQINPHASLQVGRDLERWANENDVAL